MIRKLEAFGAYNTGVLPASQKWTSSTGVVIVADAGRSGFTGDNAAFFDTSLSSKLVGTISCTPVTGVSTVTHGMAWRILTLVSEFTLFSVLTSITRIDVVATSQGVIEVRQTTGGVLLGTICQTATDIVPIGTGGFYVELRTIFTAGLASAVQIRVSDQYGDMNPLAQGAFFALLNTEVPLTVQIGGGLTDGAATGYMTDFYQTDGVPTSTVQQFNGMALRNDGFLGNTHVQTFYATADGANLAVGNTPWTPSAGTTAFSLINEHPPDEDATYISADTALQLTTCLFASPNAAPFGQLNCSATAPIFGIQWDGRLRVETTDVTVAPIVREIVSGDIAGDDVQAGDPIVVSGTDYLYYPQVFNRNPTASNAPWTFAAFLPAGVGVPGTLEFGVRLEA